MMMPPMGAMPGVPPGPPAAWGVSGGFSKPDEKSEEDVINENQKITTNAIKEAVELATKSDYGESISVLLNAIAKVKNSKVGKHERTKVMLSSLNDCLHGIEEKSFGAPRRDSHDRGSKSRRRDRSRERDRRDRSSSRDRERERKRARSRSRERRRSEYDDRERDRR
ncbi:Oidioi.mRNA.OKI2018_I69.chr1.g3869.t1.cds [Oikopleura dioica]|uniref:Oidioi.mRNA.OKI2018_I69.chr1.g3869.t1.cds n=1 Tax=Oikopleura dioica TaxID=34765 RepID=A0ABN7SX79_OIKDI|nr:Oidioi.mRNA.OKI2018_I69.chr1.g3869.t1.cds [Oikopleura dioica]